MDKKILGIIIAVVVITTILFFGVPKSKKVSPVINTPSQENSVVTDPVIDMPEINPFKNEVNPMEGYKNPFDE